MARLGETTEGAEKKSDKRSARGAPRDRDSGQSPRETVVEIRRVAKVVKGGRRFSFSSLVVVGGGNEAGEGGEGVDSGKVGIGTGKAHEVQLAISKGIENASRNIVTVPVKKKGATVYYPIYKRYGAAKIMLRPAAVGTGIIASASMRAVLERAGIQNVIAKSMGSSNRINVVRATMAALMEMETPEQVARRRGKTVDELFGQNK